jgi:hypothetical protein
LEEALDGTESTRVEGHDAQDKLTRFAVHEGWTYILLDEEVRSPELARRMEYQRAPRQGKGEGEGAVLIGMQIEDCQRQETKVRADTIETALKAIMAREVSPIQPHYFLRIQGASGQAEDIFAIRRQWTYILGTKPRQRAASLAGKKVNVRLRAPGLFEKHASAVSDWT